jgi:hypothetical protein
MIVDENIDVNSEFVFFIIKRTMDKYIAANGNVKTKKITIYEKRVNNGKSSVFQIDIKLIRLYNIPGIKHEANTINVKVVSIFLLFFCLFMSIFHLKKGATVEKL